MNDKPFPSVTGPAAHTTDLRPLRPPSQEDVPQPLPVDALDISHPKRPVGREQSAGPRPHQPSPAVKIPTAPTPSPVILLMNERPAISYMSRRAQYLSSVSLEAMLGPALIPAGKTASTVLKTIARCFDPSQFKALNAGYYHSAAHPANVATVAVGMAKVLGLPTKQERLLRDAALLHDADERKDFSSGEVHPGTPARVHATLHWIDDNAKTLKERFGWSDRQMLGVKTLIARTDFPFDDKPRRFGTRYDGQSPVQVYENLLAQLPEQDRALMMNLGLVLRFADQIGNYCGTFKQAEHTTRDLAKEIHIDPSTLHTAAFLRADGTDLDFDRQIAARFGVDANALMTREQLLQALPADIRGHLDANTERFAEAEKQ